MKNEVRAKGIQERAAGAKIATMAHHRGHPGSGSEQQGANNSSSVLVGDRQRRCSGSEEGQIRRMDVEQQELAEPLEIQRKFHRTSSSRIRQNKARGRRHASHPRQGKRCGGRAGTFHFISKCTKQTARKTKAEPSERLQKRNVEQNTSRSCVEEVKDLEHVRDIKSGGHGRIESRGFRHPQVAKRMGKRCSDRKRHHEVEPSTGSEEGDRWTRGIRDAVTADEMEQQQVSTYVQGCEYDNITDEKLNKDKVEGALMEDYEVLRTHGSIRARAILAGL